MRAIVRPGSSDRLRATFPNTEDKLEAFELTSLESSDYTDALKDIDAVFHIASPAFLKGIFSLEHFLVASPPSNHYLRYSVGETNKEIFEVNNL